MTKTQGWPRGDRMKAISVKQPWAWAIMHAGKTIENRTQVWNYRGPLAIAASLPWAKEGGDDSLVREALAMQHPGLIDAKHADNLHVFPRGAVLGVVDLVDLHIGDGACCAPWGHHLATVGAAARPITHLVLENLRPLACPVPVRGSLGLWNLAGPALEEVCKQLAASAAAGGSMVSAAGSEHDGAVRGEYSTGCADEGLASQM